MVTRRGKHETVALSITLHRDGEPPRTVIAEGDAMVAAARLLFGAQKLRPGDRLTIEAA